MATKKRRVRPAVIVTGVIASLLALAAGAFIWAHEAAGDKIPKYTTIAGIPVGDMRVPDALAKLEMHLDSIANAPINVKAKNKSTSIKPADVGLRLDYVATLADTGGGSDSWNPIDVLNKLFGGSALSAVVQVDDDAITTALNTFAEQVYVKPVDAQLSYKKLQPIVKPGIDGEILDVPATLQALKAAYLKETEVNAVTTIQAPDITDAEAEEVSQGLATAAVADSVRVKVGVLGDLLLEPQMIAASLKFVPQDGTLVAQFDNGILGEQLAAGLKELDLKEPKSAQITIEGKKGAKPKIVPSVDGFSVDIPALAQAVTPVLAKTGVRQVNVDPAQATPDFTTEDAKALGVKEIIGEFTTYFPGSAYRYNNIGKAAKLINGTLLAPGEEFSMNAALGERTAQAGWMQGGGIANGKIDPNIYGGGISQATTTTFNAIFFAGLKDIYHKPHSLYFSRYPMGREATLDWKMVDMKFGNDSKHGVLLQAWITGSTGSQGSVTVRVWSTKTYTVKATKPVQSNWRAPGATVYDTSAGCVPQSAMSGFDVAFKREFYQDKKLVKSEPFKWSYNSLTPVVCGKKPSK